MTKRFMTLTGLLAVGALGLTGCVASAEDVAGAGAGGEESKGELTVAVFNGWEEGIATSELWKVALERQGYDVTLEYVDAAPVFQGLADGDYDFTTDVWEPVTHKEYLAQYGDSIEKLGTWNDDSKLTVAVNEDAPIDSLTELAGAADEFGNTIVGIEPGAGLTAAVQDSTIPTYGLEGMDFQTSSTPAMLAELQAATDAGENIVVTLWEPHWAYSAFPLKNLEDPEGTLGDAETLSSYGRTGFADDFPEVAEWLSGFTMDTETLSDLENFMFNENEGADDWGPVVEQWAEENQDYVDSLTS
ncbi:glycine betaine ABC transporter substrate-binding protein [Microbacterium paludicola]|uniref:Glycine betaine ABC transporter substrate-binding protein n=1 Tax=Microbacterium paludicola TaxID=300019 RepID=A0A4Y9G0T8_9MICO|nr:glycine betaine ABC transporter substrate-binding protein [Microbacterium paludicola]MBF0814926.1 glycine betaine ABC transporter substrate-binding protein [Microbacterium paludicola]TFU34655.1 glycine betaine ABC transporter substrate-binding protein [Microbacterium paludicola]